MKRRALLAFFVGALILSAAAVLVCGAALQATSSKAEDVARASSLYFPLVPGTTWVYRGTVTWFNAENTQDATSEVTLTTKVERVIHKPGATFAVLSGFPADLDWSSGEVEPKPFLLVETDKHEVFLDPVPPDFDYSKLEKDSTSLKPYLAEDNLFFRWPMKKGMKFGDPEQLKRDDNEYCWIVDVHAPKELRDIEGLSTRNVDVSTLRFVTNPDDTTVELAPGIGVLRYEYHHHGSTADTSVRLVAFRPAPGAAR